MADGFIVRKGGVTTEQALAPTITEVSTTETSITFNITNNDEQTAIIRHRLNDITDEGVILELLTGETSTNIEITGLAEGTAFNVFATANVTEKIKSNVTEKQITTVAVPAPTITLVSTDTTSIVFTLTNNSSQTKDVTYGLTSPPTTTTISLNSGETSSNQTFSGLTDTTDFTIFAQAVNSPIAETQAQTLIPTPTITQVSKTVTSITFTVRNNSRVAADVLYDLVTPPVETTLQLAANTTSANQTISGLADNTTFTVFGQTKVAGFADSAIASSSVTTDPLPVFTEATGGTTLEYDSGGKRFKSHTFTSNGNFVVSTVGNEDRNQVDYLIIAGGGGGGTNQGNATGGGGGGTGGYQTTVGTSGQSSAARNKVTVSAGQISVQVGGGGAGSSNRANHGNNGTASSVAFAQPVSTTGGGGGGSDQISSSKTFLSPGGGGTGGGGQSNSRGKTGGPAVTNQFFAGGNGFGINTTDYGSGAGGGGAGSIGQNGVSGFAATGGAGGNGLANLLRTGSNETRGFGGRGGNSSLEFNSNGANGAANRGNGGGGANAVANGGNGGAGIVVIRYEIAPSV